MAQPPFASAPPAFSPEASTPGAAPPSSMYPGNAYPPPGSNYPPPSGYPPAAPGQYPGQYPSAYPPPAYPPSQYQPGYPPPAQYPPPAGQYPPPAGQYPPPAGQYPPPAGQYPPSGQYPPPSQYPGQGYPPPTPGYAPPTSYYPGQPYAPPANYMQPAQYGGYPSTMVQRPAVAWPVTSWIYQHPRRYQIRKKLFSWTDAVSIRDERGSHILTVKREPFVGGLMHLVDHHTHQELCEIVHAFHIGMPHYKIYRGGIHYATLKQKFQFFEQRFEIDLMDPRFGRCLVVEGDWMGWDFKIFRDTHLAAVVNQQFFSITDTYGVEIMPGEDNILILACIVVIEKLTHERGYSY